MWSKMLIFWVVACFFTMKLSQAAMTEAQLKSTTKLLRKSCQPKTKVTDASIENMQKGVYDEDKNAKCYAFCIVSMLKLVDKNGNPDEESARKQLELLPVARQEPAQISGENCRHAGDQYDDKCDKAYSLLKCFYLDNPQNYFVP